MASFSCEDCKTSIPGSNCAFTLSRLEHWRNRPGCVSMCPCGYPVRAKEIRANIFTGKMPSDRDSGVNAYIYCETNTGQGHVYFGTFKTCVKGNKLAASEMSSCAVFERYSSAK